MWAYGVPAFHHILIFPAANYLCLHEFAASFHDHHLHHLWDQTGRGDTISGLHRRRYRGGFTPETVTWCYFPPCRERETENERKLVTAKEAERTWKLNHVLRFCFLCVSLSLLLKDMCLFCQSADISIHLFLSTASVCLCARLVLHLQDEQGQRDQGFMFRSIEGHTSDM